MRWFAVEPIEFEIVHSHFKLRVDMRVEICTDSLEGALTAQRGGADRVELCADLIEGGITPSAGCLRLARRELSIGLHVLVRPRSGDFLYSASELDVIREDIRMAKEMGADGVVIGCLTNLGEIDVDRMRELIGHARPMSVTFHRAFDMCRDPARALEELIALGVDRVLTSGQEASAIAGVELIASLQRLSAGRIIVMAGGGINARNVRALIQQTGISEVHLSARGSVESKMSFRNTRCSMGAANSGSEFSWKTTDEKVVREVVGVVRGGE